MYWGGGALRCGLAFLWPLSSGAKQDGAEITTLTGSPDIILCIYLIGFESCTCSVMVEKAGLTVLYTFQPEDHRLHIASLPSTLTSYSPLSLHSCSSLSVSPAQAPSWLQIRSSLSSHRTLPVSALRYREARFPRKKKAEHVCLEGCLFCCCCLDFFKKNTL